VLVEQNAMMALSVADRVVALEVGRVALSGSASELADSDELQRLYLGGHAELEAPVTTTERTLARWVR
jgi:branched-chain amino acid transport system ATP-binding protein